MSDNKPFVSKLKNSFVKGRGDEQIIDNTGNGVQVSLDGYLIAPLEEIPLEVLQSIFPNCDIPRTPETITIPKAQEIATGATRLAEQERAWVAEQRAKENRAWDDESS